MDSQPFLPYNKPDIGDLEIAEVVDTLRSGWLTTGPKTAAFEREFGAYVGAKHALAVNSCTAALHLALEACGIGPGDEVITTPLTFCATVNVILRTGAAPVLVDVGADLNLDPERVAAAITPRTRAILPVHFGGLPCAMESIWDLARQHGLRVIEDAAHAAGARHQGVPIGGGTSDAVAFSFYATKNLATGEGGMVTTPDPMLHDRMRVLCLHGISRAAWNRYSEKGNWHYDVTECGLKYNMSDIQASIGIQQLRRLEEMTERRRTLSALYSAGFADLPELELPPVGQDRSHCWHLYVLRLNLERLSITRNAFIAALKEKGIGCSVHFIPIMQHSYYQGRLELRDPCSRANAEYERLISLPLYTRMTDDDVQRVISAVREIVSAARLSGGQTSAVAA